MQRPCPFGPDHDPLDGSGYKSIRDRAARAEGAPPPPAHATGPPGAGRRHLHIRVTPGGAAQFIRVCQKLWGAPDGWSGAGRPARLPDPDHWHDSDPGRAGSGPTGTAAICFGPSIEGQGHEGGSESALSRTPVPTRLPRAQAPGRCPDSVEFIGRTQARRPLRLALEPDSELRRPRPAPFRTARSNRARRLARITPPRRAANGVNAGLQGFPSSECFDAGLGSSRLRPSVPVAATCSARGNRKSHPLPVKLEWTVFEVQGICPSSH
jgi:hypothetical protein